MDDILENRRHFRLKRFMDINWQVQADQIEGEGTLINISQSGVLMFTDKVFKPGDKCVMTIAPADEEPAAFTSKQGRVVWLKRIAFPQPRLQCGIEFLSSEQTDARFNTWLQEEILKLGEATNMSILKNYLV